MAVDPGTPRPTAQNTEPDPVAALMLQVKKLTERIDQLERGTTLRDAAISGGVGLTVLDPNGNVVVTLSTQNGGGVIASDTSGNQMAIFGPLQHSAPGSYGVEVNVSGTWVQLGAQVATWGNLSGKPATFPPTLPIAGSNVSGAVATATHATDATGSNSGYNNTVTGTSFVAAWLGNDANYSFGRNTSSIRYKQNVREHHTDPAEVLNLIPVLYDRIPTDGPAPTNEYGLIAEQVVEHVPELITWYEGEIDGIRYDLVGVALLTVVREHAARIAALEATAAAAAPGQYTAPAPQPFVPNVPASAAPDPQPAPLPYTIQPQPTP